MPSSISGLSATEPIDHQAGAITISDLDEIEELVIRAVDKAFEVMASRDRMRVPNSPRLPDEMRAVGETSESWVPWKPVSSTSTEAELDQLESELGLRFPAIYRIFLRHKHFIELDGVRVRFERHPVGSRQANLRDLYAAFRPERIAGRGLLLIGNDDNDAGLVCFDTNRRATNQGDQGDCPVVVWCHDCAPEHEVTLLFSSGQKMFECLDFALDQPIPFIYGDEDDDEEVAAQKAALLGRLLNLDPTGAGGEA